MERPARSFILALAVLSSLSLSETKPLAFARNAWPSCQVGPDSFEYFHLGGVPVGSSALKLELVAGWAKVDKGPLLCLRNGGPPLPSTPLPSLGEAARVATENSSLGDQGGCAWWTASSVLQLNSSEVLQGSWWVAVYSDPSDERTQSKMIQRGNVYPFSLTAEVTVCASGLFGPSCKQPVTVLSPQLSSARSGCLDSNTWSYFALYISSPSSQLNATVLGLTTNTTANLVLQRGALPGKDSGLASNLVTVSEPKLGWWYFGVYTSASQCLRLDLSWKDCPQGAAGKDCEAPMVSLQRTMYGGFLGTYIPGGVETEDPPEPSSDGWFPVLTKDSSIPSWLYFSFDLPPGTSGQVLTVELISRESPTQPKLLLKQGGLPTLDSYDLVGVTPRGASRSQRDARLEASVVYPEEGQWFAGVVIPEAWGGNERRGLKIRVRTHECLNGCSGHGSCGTYYEATRLRFVSWCQCDRTHGGVDCSVEVLSPAEEDHHVAALTLSNAAVAPASWWAFRHKAYPEWLVFTLAGIFSAVYHSCDAGGFCAADYNTLQFADFFLSFFSVVMTCLYIAPLPSKAQQTTELAAAILLALVARDNATSGWNLVLVAALGAAGLLLGWLVEFILARKTGIDVPQPRSSFSPEDFYSLVKRLKKLLSQLRKRFVWPWVGAGFGCLVVAKVSWSYETGATYWLWHSLWHVSIFLAPYCFLRATEVTEGAAEQGSLGQYERLGHLSRRASMASSIEESELDALEGNVVASSRAVPLGPLEDLSGQELPLERFAREGQV